MRRIIGAVLVVAAAAFAGIAGAPTASAATGTYTKSGSCTSGNSQIIAVATWGTDTTKPSQVQLRSISYQLLRNGVGSSWPTSLTLADRMNSTNYSSTSFDPTASSGTWTIGTTQRVWTFKTGRNAYARGSAPGYNCGPIVIPA
jgi:hypothetical protein